MSKIILTIIGFIFSIGIFAQDIVQENTQDLPKNGINLSAYGGFSYGAINYERFIYLESNMYLSTELGIGYGLEAPNILWASGKPLMDFITIPHHITANIGKGKHYFEFGIEGTILYTLNTNNYENGFHSYTVAPMIGYRFMPLKSNKLYFKLEGSWPIHELKTGTPFYAPYGIGVGLNFK